MHHYNRSRLFSAVYDYSIIVSVFLVVISQQTYALASSRYLEVDLGLRHHQQVLTFGVIHHSSHVFSIDPLVCN